MCFCGGGGGGAEAVRLLALTESKWLLGGGKCRAALAEAKKDAEEASVVAETREDAFRSREAAAEERAAAAECRARRWEKKADELGQALSHKVKRNDKVRE